MICMGQRSMLSRDDDGEPPAAAGARKRGRPVGDRKARRAELLDAALAVVSEEGYAAATLRKVAERAGCTTGAVTYYFANREEMMAAVVEGRFDMFDSLMRGDRAGGVRAGLQRWMDLAGQDGAPERVIGLQLIAQARHEPALAAVYQRRYARYREALAAILSRGQADGTVRSDIPADVLSDQLCAMADGWMMMLPIEPERFRAERVQTLLDCTMALIAPR
jgi:TetR/AcrR family transcriptional regulator, transcriptional repressor of aconitase